MSRTIFFDFDNVYVDTNTLMAARFYRMHQATLAPLWLEPPSVDAGRIPHLTLHSEPTQPFVLQYSADLVSWQTLIRTNNWPGIMQIDDRAATNVTARFYRANALPWGTLTVATPSPAQPRLLHRQRHLSGGLLPGVSVGPHTADSFSTSRYCPAPR